MIRKLMYALVVCSLTFPLFAGEQLGAGEAMNGFPNWAERVIHEWMNRARVDPQVDLAGCGSGCADRACYAAMPPLFWSEALNRSARYHADEQSKQGYFDHNSHCSVVSNIDALYPAGCDGSASCGCVGGTSSCAPTCTAWSQRIGLFGGGASGEIIASTSDPDQTFYLWLWEYSNISTCTFGATAGHRWLILESIGSVGVGVSGQAVGDFGGDTPSYRIASGSHYPQQAESVELWANWYDANAPRSAAAVVDGRCISMSLKRGTPKNGAWSATATGVGSGCHRYYFSFIDSTGTEVTYPATGSLAIGIGAACADWDATRLRATCTSAPPPVSSRHRSARH